MNFASTVKEHGVEIVGYLAAAAGLYSTYARTMIPLRAASIVANVLFIAYGALRGIYPTIIVNCVLLPLNFIRLRDMQVLISQAKSASQGDLNVEWLRPFLTRRRYKAGDVIWLIGDIASEAVFIFSGEVQLVEIGTTVGNGDLIGEMGLFNPGQRRMLSAQCTTDVEAGALSYEEFRLLYYQNPEFGFYLIGLLTRRFQESFAKIATPGGRTAFHVVPPALAAKPNSPAAPGRA